MTIINPDSNYVRNGWKRYTNEEKLFLIRNHTGKKGNTALLALHLGRTETSIWNQVKRMGISKGTNHAFHEKKKTKKKAVKKTYKATKGAMILVIDTKRRTISLS
jgi:hypothetical protein